MRKISVELQGFGISAKLSLLILPWSLYFLSDYDNDKLIDSTLTIFLPISILHIYSLKLFLKKSPIYSKYVIGGVTWEMENSPV